MKTWQLFVGKPIVRRIALGGVGILIVSTAAVRAALRLLDEEPERRLRLHGLIAHAERELVPLGVKRSSSQILPLVLADDARTMAMAARLQQAGFGYSGIVVAALARYNPFAVVVVAFLLGGLANAGYSLQGPDFPAGLVGVLQGMILFFALGGELLVRYRVSFRTRNAMAAATR